MVKIVEIKACDECPHFYNEYYGYDEKCTELNRVISQIDAGGYHIIPEDCPLKDG